MTDITSLDTFTRAYLECALWSSTDNADDTGGEPLDRNYSEEDIAPETLAVIVADCRDFQESFGPYIERDLSQAGHDFWLTRNHHGAGFWDGDWDEPYVQLGADHAPDSSNSLAPQYHTVGNYLTAMSHPYGEFNLYLGDDFKIHGS